MTWLCSVPFPVTPRTGRATIEQAKGRLESCGCPLRRCLSPRLRCCIGVLPLDSVWLDSESAIARTQALPMPA